jgi:hypothetical protein
MHRLVIAMLALGTTFAQAQDKKVMHCFAFTEITTATPADWQAFAKATEALPSQIPGLKGVWHGKLSRPMGLVQPDGEADPEAVKKLRAGESVPVKVKLVRRQYGVCMDFASQDALKAYAGHAAHAEWVKVYEKVRVEGTTTIDIIGQ